MRRVYLAVLLGIMIVFPLLFIVSFGGGYADTINVVIDYKGLGYDVPPQVIAGVTIPGVGTFTPVVEVGRSLSLSFKGLRDGLELLEDGFNSGRIKAVPSITLGLIDYSRGGMRVKQVVITPSALALLRDGPESIRKASMDPLGVFRSRSGELTIRVDPSSLKTMEGMGLVKEVEIPRGFSDLADSRPTYRVKGSFDDYINIPGCVRWDGALAYYDVSLSRAAYKLLDEYSPFYGYLANRSVPYFWAEHVDANPEDSWLGLVSSVYAAEYMIEYRQGDDIDSVLRNMLPGVSEYIRVGMGGPNELEPPPIKEPTGGGYLSYGTMDYWLGYEGADPWIDTKDLTGISSIDANNVILLEMEFDASNYSGDPDILWFSGAVTIFNVNLSITGYGVAGVYTSSVNLYRSPAGAGPVPVIPGHTTYIYGDIVFHLGSDVGVILYDVLGIGVDECGDEWIVVEPVFLFYVDVIPEIINLSSVVDARPVSNIEFIDDHIVDYMYYHDVYTLDEFDNRIELLKRWSVDDFYSFNSAYYIGTSPVLDILELLLTSVLDGPQAFFLNLIGIFTNIAYEAYNVQGVGIYLSATLYDTYTPPTVAAEIKWIASTTKYFRYTQLQDKPLPLIGSRMKLVLQDYN